MSGRVETAALRALLARSTPARLKALKGCDVTGDDPDRWGLVIDVDAGVGIDHHYIVAVIENGAPGDTLDTEEANARLFAALRNDAAAMLDELDALRELQIEAQSVLDATGCDGDLCMYVWHERLRRKLSDCREVVAKHGATP